MIYQTMHISKLIFATSATSMFIFRLVTGQQQYKCVCKTLDLQGDYTEEICVPEYGDFMEKENPYSMIIIMFVCSNMTPDTVESFKRTAKQSTTCAVCSG